MLLDNYLDIRSGAERRRDCISQYILRGKHKNIKNKGQILNKEERFPPQAILPDENESAE